MADDVNLADALRAIAKDNRRGVVVDGTEHPQAALLLHAADALDAFWCGIGAGVMTYVFERHPWWHPIRKWRRHRDELRARMADGHR